MHTPRNDHEIFEQEKRDALRAKRLTRYEMQVAGVVVYVVAMTVFFVVALVFMLFWNETAVTRAHAQAVKPSTNAPLTAEQRNKLAELTQPLPTPQPHAEDVNDDIAVLHAREDLLLDNYTWADSAHATVRIPIEHAMALLAQRGLPSMSAPTREPLMTGDMALSIAHPLTSGFARTEKEQDQLHGEK